MVTDQLVIVRGSGAAVAGILHSLRRAGYPVLVLADGTPEESDEASILTSALKEGVAEEDGIRLTLAENLDQAQYLLFEECCALMVDPDGAAAYALIDTEEKYSEWDTGLTTLEGGGRHVFLLAVVLACPSGDVQTRPAPFVLGIGESYAAGINCDAVLCPTPGQSPLDIGNAAAVTITGFAARKAVDETD